MVATVIRLIRVIRLLRCLLIMIGSLTFVACGVQVEVATPTPPKATPYVLPYLQDTGVTRQLARPQIAFTQGGQGVVELFGIETIPDVPLIVGKQLSLEVPYDATWYTSTQGTARIRVSILTRTQPEQEWQKYDSAELELSSTQAPNALHDGLWLSVTTDQSGLVYIRVELEVLARLADGILLTRSGAQEFSVIVLPDPGEVTLPVQAVVPALGEVSTESLLFDWRVWQGGPCELVNTIRAKNAVRWLETACAALEANDYPNVLIALTNAAAATADPGSKATIYEMAGLILVSQGDYDQARQALQPAAEVWLRVGETVKAAIAVQNLACANGLLSTEPDAVTASITSLERALELHWQYDDPVGRALVLANLGRITEDLSLLYQAVEELTRLEVPQRAIVELWITQLENANENPASQ